MARKIQYIILGICLATLTVMWWVPSDWIAAMQQPYYRGLCTIGIVLFLFILPAYTSVFFNEKVRPGRRVPKSADTSS